MEIQKITNSVNELNMLSSLDTGYIQEAYFKVARNSLIQTTCISVNGFLRYILYLMRKAGLIQLQKLLNTVFLSFIPFLNWPFGVIYDRTKAFS